MATRGRGSLRSRAVRIAGRAWSCRSGAARSAPPPGRGQGPSRSPGRLSCAPALRQSTMKIGLLMFDFHGLWVHFHEMRTCEVQYSWFSRIAPMPRRLAWLRVRSGCGKQVVPCGAARRAQIFEIHPGSGGHRAGIDPHSPRFGQVGALDGNGAYRSWAMSARKSPGPTRTLCVRPMIVPEVPAV